MKTEQRKWTKDTGWTSLSDNNLKETAQLVFLFGETSLLKDPKNFEAVKSFYPKAHILAGSTAGEIIGTQVLDNSLVVTAVRFSSTPLKVAKTKIEKMGDSFTVGEKLADSLEKAGLVHVLVLSDGLHVNGTKLVNGLTGKLPREVVLTGGLAGDQDRFKETVVGLAGIIVYGR